MLKSIQFSEIKDRIIKPSLGSGTEGTVYDIGNGEIYKRYHHKKRINHYYKHHITYLEHYRNLSKIDDPLFKNPTGIEIIKDHIIATTANKAEGKLICEQDITFSELLPSDDDVRRSIKSISHAFYMTDLSPESIFFSKEKGVSLVDTDRYREIKNNFENLNLNNYYWAIIRSLGYSEFFTSYILGLIERKGLDYYRIEVIMEILDKYAKEHRENEGSYSTFKRIRI